MIGISARTNKATTTSAKKLCSGNDFMKCCEKGAKKPLAAAIVIKQMTKKCDNSPWKRQQRTADDSKRVWYSSFIVGGSSRLPPICTKPSMAVEDKSRWWAVHCHWHMYLSRADPDNECEQNAPFRPPFLIQEMKSAKMFYLTESVLPFQYVILVGSTAGAVDDHHYVKVLKTAWGKNL